MEAPGSGSKEGGPPALRRVSPNPWGDRDMAIIIDGVDGASASDSPSDLEKVAASARAEAIALALEAEEAAKAATDALAALECARAASAAASASAAATALSARLRAGALRPRTWYVDWLRTFLTLIVVLHHCTTTYLGSSPWTAKRKDDTALWLLTQLFVNGNQAYFMTLFFFISGIYVPSSFERKGALRFLGDRTLRLMLPCVVYSLLAPPFMNWWAGYVKDPASHPSLGSAFSKWLAPGWPTTYMLPTGPPWFIYMLWCFNVAYVILACAAASRAGAAVLRRLGCCCCGAGAAVADEAAKPAPRPRYTARQALGGGAALIAVLFVACYGVRMLDLFAFNLQPSMFVQRGPFVQFMPDYLPVYIVAFSLGVFAGPKSPFSSTADLLARLPRWGAACLAVGGVWWLQAGWLPNVVMHAMFANQKGSAVFAGSWVLRTFVEQSFCVVWSAGLLMAFRDGLNLRPNVFGEIINGAAYAAFLLHPVIIPLYAAAIMGFWFPSMVVNACAISAPVVVTAWLVGAGLKAIPGAHRIL